jgi:hypothetical protein
MPSHAVGLSQVRSPAIVVHRVALDYGRRRFALINVPRQQFSQATGETARRAAGEDR